MVNLKQGQSYAREGQDGYNLRTIVPPYGELTKEKPEWGKKPTECWNKGQGKRWQWPGTGGDKRDGEEEPYRKCGEEVN